MLQKDHSAHLYNNIAIRNFLPDLLPNFYPNMDFNRIDHNVISRLYHRELSKFFGISAILFPLLQELKLGDYGLHRGGVFEVRGNIFEDFRLDYRRFLTQSFSESDAFSYFVIPPLAEEFRSEPVVDARGRLMGQVEVHFPECRGFLLQLKQAKNESLLLSSELEQLILLLITQGKWQDSYQIVWQREVAESYFARTMGRGGKISLVAELDGPYHTIADHELRPDLRNCSNIILDEWISPKLRTPAVNLATFSLNSPLGRGPEGINGYEDLPNNFEVPSFIFDNTIR
jgi:hypothetical protein